MLYSAGVALLNALLTVIVPVVLVAGTGAVLGRRYPLDSATISKISLQALTPALALHTLLTTQVTPRAMAQVAVAFLAVTAVGVLLGLGGAALLGLGAPQRRAVMVTGSLGNTGNMGLPIALFALGQVGFEQSVLLFIASVVIGFFLYPLVYGSAGGVGKAVATMVRMPVMWAMALAVVLRVLGLRLPTGVMSGVELLGSAALPMVLLALGIQLGASGRPRITPAVLLATAIRVLVMPALSVPVGLALGMHGLPLQSLVLASAMPSAVNAYLFAVEMDGDVRTVGDTVTVTTLLSFLTVAFVTWALGWVGAL